MDPERDSKRQQTQRQSMMRTFLQALMWSGLLVGMGFVTQSIGMLFYARPLFSSLFLLGGAILIPVLLTQELLKYRLILYGGRISYARCVTVMGVIYLFALVVGTLAYLLVFTYLFRDIAFLTYLEQSVETAAGMLASEEERELLRSSYAGMTPMQMTTGAISLSFTLGTIYIFFASIFLRRG